MTKNDNSITEITRREIIDELTLESIDWSGRLSETDFLSRIYDLSELPSTDSRHSTAEQDIGQHRESFVDWEDVWVFYDDRFNILNGSDENFLRFICETIHPVVRPNEEMTRNLAERFNEHLEKDGWELYEKKQISGRPVWGAKSKSERHEVFSEPTGWEKVDRQIQEARSQLEEAETEEQYQLVGKLCKEALISLGEVVFDSEIHDSPDDTDPSDTDAKRRLQGFIESELSGGSNYEARSHAKKAVKLADALRHKRTADFTMAALCVEATASVINIAAIVSGRRERIFHQKQQTT